ncbi:NAD(P)H-dependent oxidoreductase [Wielerella bovis]|uniref:NAD(P)H-dependent oxidoreductase n=1 Tax=Wielerella bovis TaxID=2917790 RepID=UPI002018CAC8|nr:NAD(P)H-dependent oxidoreductase [Wielerella bovis]ULJ61941.1 NAD(P)H-dependent oxidoreductase [Wielerella bovis]ULJ64126.1 NAD(P)H-dependent oxidoreductase [Wielerella bovis]ULJ67959.1 NAD(P)H-dependent oxidoreductase [Wielerella bovis]
MSNILIVSGHPDLKNSIANRTILDTVANTLPNVQIRKLDELYPNFQIDVPAEQDALLWADVIVWQFPLHWYSVPALMKKWFDEVFLHGFAYGSTAKLHGKKLLLSFTTAGTQADYQVNGDYGHSIDEFLTGFVVSAEFCGLKWQTPIVGYGFSFIDPTDETAVNAHKALATQYANQLIDALK